MALLPFRVACKSSASVGLPKNFDEVATMSEAIPVVQPECDKIEVWDDDDHVYISQKIPLLREEHLITIHKAFVPRLQAAINSLVVTF